jgi:phospholipid transport system substrate-binding protein
MLFAAAALAGPTPSEIIESTATDVDQRLAGRKEYLEANPDELFSLVNEVLLPHFDREYAARLVLARNWRSASAQQRERFVDVFYNFLLRNYAKGVLQFDRDSLVVLPEKGKSPPGKARVSTEMSLDDGTRVPVDYFFRQVDDEWRVFDVKIEGVSYVVNYRNQFKSEIKSRGLDAVIARLESDTGEDGQGEVADES